MLNTIDFAKYSSPIASIKFNEQTYDNYPCGFTLFLTNGVNFKFTCYYNSYTTGVIKQWLCYDFSKLIGKTIIDIKEDEIPDEFYPEEVDEDDDFKRFITYSLIKFTFDDNDYFKFLLVSYSICGCCDSFLESNICL